MTKALTANGFKRLWLLQLAVLLVLGLAAFYFFSIRAGLSVLLGGLVGLIPNILFAKRLFKYQGAHAAKRIVNAFYQAEAIKIVISVLLFAFIFLWVKIDHIAFFLGYIVILVSHWFSPFVIMNRRHRPESD